MSRSPALPWLVAAALAGAAVVVGVRAWTDLPAPPAIGTAPQLASTAQPVAAPERAGGVPAAPDSLPPESAPAPRAEVVPVPFTLSQAGEALLARAKTDRSLTLVTAEVLQVDAIAVSSPAAGGLRHQDLHLRILATDRAVPRRWATVKAPLCPASAEAKYGCSTALGSVQAGEVRTFVFARGRPDLGALGALLADRVFWIALAGPLVPRPHDPVLSALPPELLPWLGRPLTNVFRARVRAVLRRAERPRNPLQDADRVDVDVLEIAQQGGRLPLGRDVRISQAPFVPGLDLAALAVGREYWLATEDAAFWQVLHAFAPVR
ncbi:MAG: hypothetical protein WAT39_18210 [Planctomycetota bacterium]